MSGPWQTGQTRRTVGLERKSMSLEAGEEDLNLNPQQRQQRTHPRGQPGAKASEPARRESGDLSQMDLSSLEHPAPKQAMGALADLAGGDDSGDG